MNKPKRVKRVDSLTDLVSLQPTLGFEIHKFDGLSLVTNIGTFMLSDEHLFLNKEPILVSQITERVDAYKQEQKSKKKNALENRKTRKR